MRAYTILQTKNSKENDAGSDDEGNGADDTDGEAADRPKKKKKGKVSRWNFARVAYY